MHCNLGRNCSMHRGFSFNFWLQFKRLTKISITFLLIAKQTSSTRPHTILGPLWDSQELLMLGPHLHLYVDYGKPPCLWWPRDGDNMHLESFNLIVKKLALVSRTVCYSLSNGVGGGDGTKTIEMQDIEVSTGICPLPFCRMSSILKF